MRAFAFDVKGVRDVPFALLAPDDVDALTRVILEHLPVEGIDPAGLEQFRSAAVSDWLLAHLETVVG